MLRQGCNERLLVQLERGYWIIHVCANSAGLIGVELPLVNAAAWGSSRMEREAIFETSGNSVSYLLQPSRMLC